VTTLSDILKVSVQW